METQQTFALCGPHSNGQRLPTFSLLSKFRISKFPRLKPAMPPAASPGGGRRRGTAGEAPTWEKRPRESEDLESESGSDDGGGGSGSDSDGDFVSDLREIVCLLRLIKGGADKEGQKMCEQIIASVAADIQTMLEDTKLKFEKERQNLLKVLSNTSKECDSSLSKEYIKFQESYEIFCKEKDVHVQAFRDLFSKVEVEKKALLQQFENHRKETATLSELDNTFSEKITHAEQSLRKTEVDNTISAKITHAEQSLRRTQFDTMFSGKKTQEEQSLRMTEFDNTFSEKVTHAEQSLRRMKQDHKSFIILRKSVGSFLEFGSDDDFDLDDD